MESPLRGLSSFGRASQVMRSVRRTGRENHALRPTVWIGLVLVSVAVAAGVYLLRQSLTQPRAPESPGRAAGKPFPEPSRTEEIIARFVGHVGDVGLPDAPVRVFPIGHDPRFVLPVTVSRVVEGALPQQGGEVRFLIHSPALFFGRNLGELPAGNHPEGEFIFTLVATGSSDGTAYDLRMARLDDGAMPAGE
jgi:hypothetical protein